MKIVYESNAGHTEKYAIMLSEVLNLPCVKLKNYKPDFEKVIFMGWVMAGMIKGYSKIKNKVSICCTIAVGLLPDTKERINELIKNNDIKEPLFYLQGGVDYGKLKWIKKRLLKAVCKKMTKDTIDKQKEIVKIIKHGKSLVKKENLEDIIDYLNTEM